ncbi:coniferyl alcohol acyltransferase [Raphanus sativus]|uniref:Coniferyl alcohol acyltransferase n=1 Tax=Raphanus sativus TaxID=3726 RepID=A0A6J0MBJ7_RAPSA|nr:coniferyl alcohol acyltransferase [Raphanus sativus]
MTASEARGFHVTTTRKEIVAPASAPLLPLPENRIISLSNLDLLLPPVDINVCFFYKKPLYNTTNDVLKTSLAEALVSYYVLAGEVVANPITGEPEIFCSGAGVEVVEAAADVEPRELNLHDPYQSIAKFVPIKTHGVFAIQVTELKCGSLVVGCTFDHRIADAYSMNMFLLSWAEISRSDAPTSYVHPFKRSLLNPRRPLVIDSSLDQMYMPVTSLPPPQEITNPDNILTSHIYYIKADVVQQLQTLAGNRNRTKLESFCAFLWKLVAKHAATTDSKLLNSKLGIVVDGRKKLMDQETNTYFGNVLSVPYGEQSIDDLNHKPLSWVADEVHKVLESSVTKDHFLNLIDWIETRRPVPVLSRIYGAGYDDGPAFVVSSGKSFPVKRIDFGWGSPVFGSYHLPRGSRTGYVMTMPSPVVDNSAGDWIVYLHLAKGQLKFIEQEAPHVFKPIDNDYLKI